MKKILLLLILLTSWAGIGQVIIAQQDFETTAATPTWSFTNTNGAPSVTNTGTPNNQRIRTGTRSFQVSNAASTLTFPAFSVTGHTDVRIIVRISSISVNATNGADATDFLRLFSSINGAAFTANSAINSDISITGANNSQWGYNTTGVSTAAGTNVSRSGTTGTDQGTIYSTLIINIPNGTSTVGLRINATNNDANEVWCIDDVIIEGTSSCAPTAPAGSITGTTPACDSTILAHSAPTAGETYWQTSPTAELTTNPTTSTFSALTSGTYYVRRLTGSCWSTSNLSYAVVINQSISISTQPTNRSILAGANTTFGVSATGTTPAYQWQVDAGSGFNDIINGAPYSNVNTATLTITNATAGMNGYVYRCVVSGASPCASFISNNASLTVALPPVPVVSAAAPSGIVNTAFTYNIIASNTPTSYAIASGTLPAGLAFNSTTGQFSGTPTAAGSTVLAVTATNAGGTSTAVNITISILTGPCLSADFAVNGLPASWIQANVTFQTNRAEMSANTGSLTTTAVAYPTSLSFTLERTGSATAKTLVVEISTTAQTSGFTTIATYDHANTTSGGTININLDLSAFINNPNVYIRLRKISASSIARWGIDDISITCGTPCTPPTIASIFPNSSSENTEITITASSGNLTNSTVTFGGVAAIPISSSTNTLIVKVPAGATTGELKITDSQPCDATSTFTVIDKDVVGCLGGTGAVFTDLIISEVYDDTAGDGGYIEIFNGTSNAIDMTAGQYRIRRYADFADTGAPAAEEILTGTIAAGQIILMTTTGTNTCSLTTTFSLGQGFNANDRLDLTKGGANTVLDRVRTPGNTGFSMNRISLTGPSAVFNGANWSTINTEDCSNLGFFNNTPNLPPSITTQPSLSLTCSDTTANIAVIATEGVADATGLSYQWFFAAPNSNFMLVPNAAPYQMGSNTSSNLIINNISGLNNYQYYCEVREGGSTCFVATRAIKLQAGEITQWNGSLPWTNGLPSLTKAIIINGIYNTAIHGNIDACSIKVNTGQTLTVANGTYINIENQLNNDGIVNIENNGSLVQTNDNAVNTGTINFNRIASIRLQDYVYWSSPINSNVSSNLITAISPNTPLGNFWTWTPTGFSVNTSASQLIGNWINASSGHMIRGKGYSVRGPSGTSNATTTDLTTTFSGVPNNGVVTIEATRGTYDGINFLGQNGATITKDDDNWNFIGNPYPSAIDVTKFLTDNPDLEGDVQIWSHGTLPNTTNAQPFYNSFGFNYSINDYIIANGTGSTPAGYNNNIPSAQGFFVRLKHNAMSPINIVFNNSQRKRSNTVLDNSQFYRTSAVGQNTTFDKSRIWLDLIQNSAVVQQTLVGYIDQATDGIDRLFDSRTDLKNDGCFYSLINSETFAIQGKNNSFATTDQIPLGLKTTAGNFTIAINKADGLFANNAQFIYLQDKYLNVIHNLSSSPYIFNSTTGIINDRFVLRFDNLSLNDISSNYNINNIKVYSKNQTIKIDSAIEKIKSIEVFDLLGRIISENSNVDNNSFEINTLTENNAALLLKIKLESEVIITKKIVF